MTEKKQAQKTTYLVPVAEGPGMHEVLSAMSVRASCGSCSEVGCSWCNASVPGRHMKLMLVSEAAPKA